MARAARYRRGVVGTNADGALQRQARALSSRTRLAILREIEASDEALGVRELAAAVDVHQSAARQHLATLLEAGLVLEARDRTVRTGRPRHVYRRAPGVLGVWASDNPFERLAALLLDALRSGAPPRVVGAEAGRAIAESPEVVGGTGDAVALDVLTALVALHGFEPALEPPKDADAAGPTIVLTTCPYASLATAAPEVVCELHRGLIEGMAATVDGPDAVEVVDLERHDPMTAGCRVLLQPRRATPGPLTIDSKN